MPKARQIAAPADTLLVAQELVEALPVPVYFKGRDGKYLGVNRAWEEFFGIARGDFIGREVKDLFPQAPWVARKHMAMDEELWRSPGSQSYEIPVTTRGGRVRDTIYYKATFERPDGSLGLIGAVIDITSRKRAEEELQRFRLALDNSADIIVLIDRASMRFVDVNETACRLLGYTRAELLKMGPEDVLPLSRAALEQSYDALIADPATGGALKSYYRCKDGSQLPFEASRRVLRSGEGWTIVAISRDIRARLATEEALRESEQRFRDTFELAASGIAHIDQASGRFLHVNRSLCSMLGYTREELLGRTVKEVSHPEDRDLTDSQRMRVISGELPSVRFEKRYLRKGGATIWVSLAIALVRGADGKPRYEIAVFDDISERKRAEAERRLAHEALDQKAKELARSNAELEQFAYVASHDLQEPLRMISSYTQLLERRHGARLEGDAREFMGFIVDGAARMKQLIEDLLAYSRVGTRGREFLPMESGAALRKALGNLRAAIEEAGAEVTSGALPALQADELQLVQVFQNLVGNALKFRSKESIQIKITCSEKPSEWEFAVQDNGIGIDPQYFERIFMVFQRLHSKDEYPGTGIGLAVCKKVIDRHGGRIWVESQPGRGSTFRFTLPKHRESNHE